MERSAAPGWKFCSDTGLSALPAAISPLPWRPRSVFFNNRQLRVPRAFPLAPPPRPSRARTHMHLLIRLTTPVRGADVPPALMSSTATARSCAGLCSVMLTKHTHTGLTDEWRHQGRLGVDRGLKERSFDREYVLLSAFD